jgi:phosphatidylethanolamine/phosphatidyl-N-methylethanolamine N-methyltransferase
LLYLGFEPAGIFSLFFQIYQRIMQIFKNTFILVDWTQPSLWISLSLILFCPLFWVLAARAEYHRKIWSQLMGGCIYRGCYLQSACIFSLGLLRDRLYVTAMEHQPKVDFHASLLIVGQIVQLVGGCLVAFGALLVAGATYRLGVTGTFSGDHFGIFKQGGLIVSFPFNWFKHPMYVGSTLMFLGASFWKLSPAGALLSVLVWTTYNLAAVAEE